MRCATTDYLEGLQDDSMDSSSNRPPPVALGMGSYHFNNCSRSLVENMVNVMVLSREALDIIAVEALWMAEHPDMSDAVFAWDKTGGLIVCCRDKTYQVQRLSYRDRRVMFTEVY